MPFKFAWRPRTGRGNESTVVFFAQRRRQLWQKGVHKRGRGRGREGHKGGLGKRGGEKEKFAKIIWRLTPSPFPPPPPYGENRDEKKPILALPTSLQPSHNGSGSGFALSFAIVVAESLHLDSRKVVGRKDAADCACTPCKLCTLPVTYVHGRQARR